MRAIDEIWIITSGGITLFNVSKDDIDPLLIGGFFSAIQTIAQQLGEKELNSIVLGESKITVYQGSKGLLYVSRSKKKVKDKAIIHKMETVETKFMEQYADKITDKLTRTEEFQSFGDVIEEIFADTPEKRTEAALW